MPLFGALHFSILLAIGVIAAALAFACRGGGLPPRATRLAIGWTLAVNEVVWWTLRYAREGVHAVNLPLQLCDITVWLAALACITGAPAAVEFAYFAGLAGAGMALVTPDLTDPWPSYPAVYFFVAHGGIVIAVALLVFGRIVALRPGAVWRSFGLLLAYAAMVAAANTALGSNYMYLRKKPANGSLLDHFGPWPWYIVAGAAVGLALFWLLWIPACAARSRVLHSARK